MKEMFLSFHTYFHDFIPHLLCLVLLINFRKLDKQADRFKWNRTTIEEEVFTTLLTRCVYPYGICMCIHWMSYSPFEGYFTAVLYTIAYIIFFSWSLYKQLAPFRKMLSIPVSKSRMRTRIMLVCHMWVYVFVLFASINYLLFIALPQQYDVQLPSSIPLIAFEFVYYTFMLMITYSNAGAITASGIIAKSLQMAEIIVFFVFVGLLISQFLGNMNDLIDES